MKQLSFFRFSACYAFLLATLLFACEPTFATVRFVKLVSSGIGDGSSWSNASDNIQNIINVSSAGDEIWVASGTYYPAYFPFSGPATSNPRYQTFLVNDGIKLYGSFIGTETAIGQRDIMTNPTILSGDIGFAGDSSDNCFHVVVAAADTNGTGIGVTIDGFTIINGNADDFTGFYYMINGNRIDGVAGGGILLIGGKNTISNNTLHHNLAYAHGGGISVANGDAVITNNIIHDNSYSYSAGTMRGAGISLYYGNNNVYKNTIYNNSSSMDGAGINTWWCNNRIHENVINNNFAQASGAAIYTNQSTDTIDRNVIHDNTANFASVSSSFSNEYVEGNFIYNNTGNIDGGGVYFYHGTNTLVNNVLYSNTTTGNGGGVYARMGACQIVNNTFYGNAATSNGGALYTDDISSNNTIVNNIFWSNTQSGSVALAGSDLFNNNANNTVAYCITQQNSIYSSGAGIINNVDPLFLNTANIAGADNVAGTTDDGLSLQAISPARNSGTLAGSPLNDVAGTTRPQGGAADMGAYELPSSTGIAPDEHAFAIRCSIFPNPADDMLCIDTDQTINSIAIYDVVGRKVKEITPAQNSIIVSDIASGLYVVQLSVGDLSIKKKLLIVH